MSRFDHCLLSLERHVVVFGTSGAGRTLCSFLHIRGSCARWHSASIVLFHLLLRIWRHLVEKAETLALSPLMATTIIVLRSQVDSE